MNRFNKKVTVMVLTLAFCQQAMAGPWDSFKARFSKKKVALKETVLQSIHNNQQDREERLPENHERLSTAKQELIQTRVRSKLAGDLLATYEGISEINEELGRLFNKNQSIRDRDDKIRSKYGLPEHGLQPLID